MAFFVEIVAFKYNKVKLTFYGIIFTVAALQT
ncbi:hypothetical protein G3A_17415 [Bacillus sp. 17376]|nr:hypothetical protein G3A_17415 [Bacillus sp. 17376]